MKTQLVLILSAVLMLTACGKQSNKNSALRINRQANNAVNQMMGSTTCAQGQWGKIYDNNVDDATFRQRVADFSLRNIDEIGSISGAYNATTGIDFRATFAFQNGQMIPQSSSAAFKIYDSYTVQQGAGYITFQMGGLQGGVSGNQIEAFVRDEKGWIRFRVLQRDQQSMQGEVTYNNYSQGEQRLGNFVIGNCALTGN